MRIRKPILNSPSSSHSSSSSSCTSYSYSSITNNSFIASSTDSSSTSSTSHNSPTKCQGLDLLVKAIYQVTAGSIIGVPYIQKRVITRRRRRSLSFDTLCFTTNWSVSNASISKKSKGNSLLKRQHKKRLKSVPCKYQDSVFLQPKSKSKRISRSVKVSEELGG